MGAAGRATALPSAMCSSECGSRAKKVAIGSLIRKKMSTPHRAMSRLTHDHDRSLGPQRSTRGYLRGTDGCGIVTRDGCAAPSATVVA